MVTLVFPSAAGRGALERRENTPSDRDLFDLIENRTKKQPFLHPGSD